LGKEDESSNITQSISGDVADHEVHSSTDVLSISALSTSLDSKYEDPERDNMEQFPRLWSQVDFSDEKSDSEGSISSNGTAIFTGERDDDYELRDICAKDVLVDKTDRVLPKVFIL
jgi:hypothetical protein